MKWESHQQQRNRKKTNIYYFNWWARSTGPFSLFWFNSPHHYDGSVFRCFVDSLFFGGITGNNHLTSTTKRCKFKRLMSGIKQWWWWWWLLLLFVVVVVVDNSGSFFGHRAKNIALKRFATKYVHSQSKCSPFHSLQCSLSVLYVFCSWHWCWYLSNFWTHVLKSDFSHFYISCWGV